ncbi:hypothetical protein BDW22DRAFT_1043072 [Trametopsis cervina]|nr:hypothetical protein BDW22DRAFT_1043072 [Trametopsis cervina]
MYVLCWIVCGKYMYTVGHRLQSQHTSAPRKHPAASHTRPIRGLLAPRPLASPDRRTCSVPILGSQYTYSSIGNPPALFRKSTPLKTKKKNLASVASECSRADQSKRLANGISSSGKARPCTRRAMMRSGGAWRGSDRLVLGFGVRGPRCVTCEELNGWAGRAEGRKKERKSVGCGALDDAHERLMLTVR